MITLLLASLLSAPVCNPSQLSFTASGGVKRAVCDKLSDVVSLRDYGASPSAAAAVNDAALVKAFADFGAAPACGTILLPKGNYPISATFAFTNREGCILQGAGGGQAGTSCASTLTWAGAANGTVLQAFSTRWSSFRDFCVDGAGTAGIGIDDTALNATAPNQQNHFSNITVKGIGGTPGQAVHIGSATNDQVSESSFDGITCLTSGTCFYVEGTQTKNIRLIDGLISHPTSIGLDIEGGEVLTQHLDFENNTASTIDVNVAGTAAVAKVTFIDNYHEDIGQSTIVAYSFPVGIGTRTEPTTFIGGRVLYTATSGTVIDYHQQGPVTFFGTAFTSNSGAQGGVLTFAGPGATPARIAFHGGVVLNNNSLSCSGTTTCNYDQGAAFGGAAETTQFRNQSIQEWGGEVAMCDSTGANCFGLRSNSTQWRFMDTDATTILGAFKAASLTGTTGILTLKGVLSNGSTFSALGTPANGSVQYCSDCTIANPCAGSGTGALAKRLNGVWVCN